MTPDALDYVCSLVRQRSAIELDGAKSYLIEARLMPLAQRYGFPSPIEMIRSLQRLPKTGMQQELVEAMTTNETSFFRDGHPFEALRTTILPELIPVLASRRSLNIWSAACSSGQEAYSIAMTLREHFPELNTWNVQILGTDLSDEVLARARSGRFGQIEIGRGLSPALQDKYFRREGAQWELISAIRSMASFMKMNLIERWPTLPKMDVVFLRNVLIYFAPEIKKAILEKVRGVLAPHGKLFLGAAETTLGLDPAYVRVQVANSVYYRLA